MTKRYTARLNAELTQQLYELGMPLKVNSEYETDPFTGGVKTKAFPEPPTVAKTLDWLLDKKIFVQIGAYSMLIRNDTMMIGFVSTPFVCFNRDFTIAVEEAIEKAIEFLKDESEAHQ